MILSAVTAPLLVARSRAIARKRGSSSSDSAASAAALNIGKPNYLSRRSGVKQSLAQLRRVGARLLAPSRPKMRSRFRRLGCVFSPLYGFGCGSDLATGHPGRREIVAPGGCHANPDQAPDLLGLCRIDLFCLGGCLHERLKGFDRGAPLSDCVRLVAKIGHGRNPSSWPRRMARARRLRAASRRFLPSRGAGLSAHP